MVKNWNIQWTSTFDLGESLIFGVPAVDLELYLHVILLHSKMPVLILIELRLFPELGVLEEHQDTFM